MDSTKPDTRARISTVSTAVKRPVYSSHSVIDFWSGFETVTDAGRGAAVLPTGLLSHAARRRVRLVATAEKVVLVIGRFSTRGACILAFGPAR
jgi:hypothetical protein